MIWVLLLGVMSYLILCKVTFIDNARQKYSRWVSVGDPSIRPEHASMPNHPMCLCEVRQIAAATLYWFHASGENYMLRSNKPLGQSDVNKRLLNWAEDTRTSMTFADAEQLMDRFEQHD